MYTSLPSFLSIFRDDNYEWRGHEQLARASITFQFLV